ncbi:hypothetical protein EW146_g10302 [Bondarzewia mesenterica]|uniref:Uncharacterized protein n=1 Tax=Bondarzewia mesenterica TaxID=1095465 RepID=A0A4S4KYJ6_9AGAM|nr:hypothetical protein EW146_g10302 [Bondarzewia mesenterica]
MGVIYDCKPPPPDEQHGRLVALRQLIARDIPCILWGEDALRFAHSVPTSLFDQQILVPDELLESAAAIIEEGRYNRVPSNGVYAEQFRPHNGAAAFPKAIRLQHSDIPDHEPYKLFPLPGYILLLPQSYYGLDVRSAARFQSLVPPLDASNAAILVPKYHTFLEGLVEIIMNSPAGYHHITSKLKHDVFISYLLLYRVKDDPNMPVPSHGSELSSVERDILSEIQTEDCAWFLHRQMWERRCVHLAEIIEYKRQKSIRNQEPLGQASLVRKGEFSSQKGPDAVHHQRIRRYSTSRAASEYMNRPSNSVPVFASSTDHSSPVHPRSRIAPHRSPVGGMLSMFQRLARRLI